MNCYTCGGDDHYYRDCPQREHGRSGETYLAEIEDSEGHPMAMRMPLGVMPTYRPPCKHRHSLLCTHS